MASSSFQVQNIGCCYIAMILMVQMHMGAQLAVAASRAPEAAPSVSASAPVTATPDVSPAASPPQKRLSSTPIVAPVSGPMNALISAPVSAPVPGPVPLANEKSAGVMMVTASNSRWRTVVLASGVLVAAAALQVV